MILIILMIGIAGGCETATAIPGGAQQVHVIATVTEVHLNPSTVHAGDVYIVLDLPHQGVSLRLIVGSPTAGVRGPLTDADLARLAHDADPMGVASESLDVSCCGNVYKETLAAGMYAFILHDPDFTQSGRPPISMAVLEVLP